MRAPSLANAPSLPKPYVAIVVCPQRILFMVGCSKKEFARIRPMPPLHPLPLVLNVHFEIVTAAGKNAWTIPRAFLSMPTTLYASLKPHVPMPLVSNVYSQW